jgi:hypothetical protein
LAAHPSRRFDVNSNHFQLAMLAYNLNCWLMLCNRDPQADAIELRHTTLATYLTTSDISRARPTLGTLVVCIIQVSSSD